MLLSINSKSKLATHVTGKRLRDFGLDERALQEILFGNLPCLLRLEVRHSNER